MGSADGQDVSPYISGGVGEQGWDQPWNQNQAMEGEYIPAGQSGDQVGGQYMDRRAYMDDLMGGYESFIDNPA